MTPRSKSLEQRYVRVKNNVAIGGGTVIHRRTMIRGPTIICDHCTIDLNA